MTPYFYLRLAMAGVLLYGAYFTASFLNKLYKTHKYNKEIKMNFENRKEKKDDIESFQLNKESENE